MASTNFEPMLRLLTSNRLEVLSEVLAEVLGRPLSSALDKEVVVVQSKGMERWISMELARRHGICANFRFPFPNAFVYEMFRNVLEEVPEISPFDRKIMTWKIMKLLPACIEKQGFETLKNYLAGPEGDLKRFQLSECISEIFDQYLVFRPEMIFDWENNKESHWQAVLWRALVSEIGSGHPAKFGKVFLESLDGMSPGSAKFPDRVSLFGISALPRFHMRIFAALSRYTEVNIFLMNPCKEYWGEIVSDWEMKKTLAREEGREISIEELHFEKGNSLLASMGRLGRDFFDLVNEFECRQDLSFLQPGENSLLCCLQSDVLNLRERGQDSKGKKALSTDDSSIQIHSCHSPMREIEVLYDWLLDLFEKNPDFIPRDVVVMTPDVEAYAPYIRAVFDVPADDRRRLPFSIADRSFREESEVVDTFLSIIDLCGSRFGASQVLAIMESPAVQRRFGVEEADLERIRTWVSKTGIRWGIDGENREQLGLPAFVENTWREGVKRLLLGYALPGQEENLFCGILPYDDIEGGEAVLLGRFLEFLDQLFEQVTGLERPKTLRGWSRVLTELLDTFFAPDDDSERDVQLVRGALEGLSEKQERSGFDEEIPVGVIRHHLLQYLQKEGFGSGFIAGGITFCAMLPMRSIPFKVICLVGMNADAFPRQSKTIGFDLIARKPRRGDRSRRHDDRYLFLETILSAREKLYISYVGQDVQDNSPIPPSVLVNELMDYIEQGFRTADKGVLNHVLIEHRLQAFSPEYFTGKNKRFSYSEANFKAAEHLVKPGKASSPFISERLSEPEEARKTVDLRQLCAFFSNPTKFLLNQRLGIYVGEGDSILEDREPFEVKGLEKYHLEQKLVERRFCGGNLDDFQFVVRALGLLPHGTMGECVYENFRQGVEGFVGMTEPYVEGAKLEPLEVMLDIDDFKVVGRIDAIYPKRLIQYRYAKVKPKDRLRLWIHHVAMNCMKADDYPSESMLVALSAATKPVWAAWEYRPLRNCRKVLRLLLNTYWEGMARPVHFFPLSSWEYAHLLMVKGSGEPNALEQAKKKWTGNDYAPGDLDDLYNRLCFSTTDPLDSEFQRVAEKIFGPLIESQNNVII
jgi:exodeoxyribonuclease V gamma subunit